MFCVRLHAWCRVRYFSVSLQMPVSAVPPIQLVWETLLCTTEQNGWCGHVLNRYFVAGLLERGHHTHAIHLLRVNWCYTSVSQWKKATFTTLPTNNFGWQQGKKGETTTSSSLCLAFLWKWEESEQVGIAHLSQGTDELLRKCLFGKEQVTKETWRASSLSSGSLHSHFAKPNNVSEKQTLFTKRKYLLLQGSRRQLNSMQETGLICCKLNQSTEPSELWKGDFLIRVLPRNEQHCLIMMARKKSTRKS